MFAFREQYKVSTTYWYSSSVSALVFFLPAGHQIKKTGENHIADSCGEERGGGKGRIIIVITFPLLYKRGRGDLHRRDL